MFKHKNQCLTELSFRIVDTQLGFEGQTLLNVTLGSLVSVEAILEGFPCTETWGLKLEQLMINQLYADIVFSCS